MRHLLASAAVAVLMAGTAPALAETPDDQLIVAFNMNNVLTMDPAAITGGEAVQILNNIYDSLISLDPEDKTLIPRLAESWEISDDNRSVTFHLRPDATFASGNPVTAEDVAWSFERNLELNLAQSSGLKSRGFTAEAADELFVAEDEHTFVLNLPQADDPKLILMYLSQAGVGSVLDRALVEEHAGDDMGQAWLTNNSAGSGAFTLNQWRANEYVILTANQNYWEDVPEMSRVLMRHLPESQTQRLGLEQGDIDVGFTLAAPDLKALEQNEDITVTTVPSSGFYYLAASMENEQFADPKVREALRYLIDYDGINTAIMPYFGVERQRPVNTSAFAALDDPGYALDVEKAKALLAEAGYPDGFDTTIRVISTQQFLDSATAIQGTLAQAGIDAEIITGDGGQIYGAMRDRNFDLLVGRGGGGQQPHPDSNLRALIYNPDNAKDAGLTNYQGWRTSYQDEELNAKIEAALVERDADTQAAMYEEIQQMIDDKVTSIQPFSERVVTAAYQDDVSGIVIDPWVSRFEDVTKDR
ncbi:MAG: ABC transporter substrate-binding protein [Rhodobacteraceae bacterium]|jgi:peptide/nickel transport system substrate-binding protein|uniref:Peptide/nickel transport system substrate-binding protein n=1 Tax=Salipiger profundus TaxID=1229727 RepID=A0A1U7DCM4_9RHOB|nr:MULTISPECIES: ABC transporter substrate-binding protein [Salipiger]APX25826.1 peptide/nickel transport system substrate-binding protein [Salipiger profundus]MAB08449.1 ABC transporter substrate-binding protein [Paracoccaceae bacterium]SFC86611.1 peptide/nickel transport system substrate-binding protein [Salipiger profundus]